MTDHPTDAERFFFDTNGYLVLDKFLPLELLELLTTAVVQAIERRKNPGYKRAHQPAFPDKFTNSNARIMHLLDEDPLFLDLLSYDQMMPYIRGLFNEMPHLHSTDVIFENEPEDYHGKGWHIDGIQNGFRNLQPFIPLLQLNIGYFLSDMSEPDQGNLTLLPGSHRALEHPDLEESTAGTVQICGQPGTAVLFHNALWHSAGPFTRQGGKRVILYYGYEHPWMLACAEQWRYNKNFLEKLTPEQRAFFHGFVFDPPEYRWG